MESRKPRYQATFLMVARDPETKKATLVNPLLVETAEEKALFDEGERSKCERTDRGKKSLERLEPTQEEMRFIHNLFRYY